jgi:hypothetical protein
VAIDVDLRKRHHAVEVEIDAVAFFTIQLERLAVPADAFPGELGRRTAGGIGFKGPGDGPVVGNSHRFP